MEQEPTGTVRSDGFIVQEEMISQPDRYGSNGVQAKERIRVADGTTGTST
jgi:hypothetical protein